MYRILVCIIVFASSCATTQEQEEDLIKASCPANNYQHFVGKVYKNIKLKLPIHRWKRSGYLYSQEYISDRLNIVTDEKGIIIAIRCG